VDVAEVEEEAAAGVEEHQEEEAGVDLRMVVVVGDSGLTAKDLLMVQSLTFSYVVILQAKEVALGALVAISNTSFKCTRHLSTLIRMILGLQAVQAIMITGMDRKATTRKRNCIPQAMSPFGTIPPVRSRYLQPVTMDIGGCTTLRMDSTKKFSIIWEERSIRSWSRVTSSFAVSRVLPLKFRGLPWA